MTLNQLTSHIEGAIANLTLAIVLGMLVLTLMACDRETNRSPKESSVEEEQHETMPGNKMNMPMGKMEATQMTKAAGVPDRAPVQLSMPERQLINIRTTPVIYAPVSKTIRTVGIVVYDDTRVVNVNTKIMGWVEKLYVDKPGQFVTQGQPLMDIYSPDLYAGQQEYLLAFQHYQKLKNTLTRDATGVPYAGWKDNLSEAESLMRSAQKRLKLWDITNTEIRAIEQSGKPHTTLQLKAPVTGFVVEKKVDPGQMVQPGMTLHRIADLSTVWINADFYEYELPLIKKGQTVIVTLTAFPGLKLKGMVNFIYPYLENKTRTATVRLVLPNSDGLLKPDMYADVELDVNLGKQLLVPAEAVFNTGLRQYVFVQMGEGMFMPRLVTLGPKTADRYVIREGLKEGEQVVIDGNFLLDSESQLKGATGSGMGGHQH